MDVTKSPSSLVDDYHEIWYFAGGIFRIVSVNKYRCAAPQFGGTIDAEAFKDDLISTGQVASKVRAVRVFMGKGSIQDIADTMEEIYRAKDALLKLAKGAKDPGKLDFKAAFEVRTKYSQEAAMKERPADFDAVRKQYAKTCSQISLQQRAHYDELLNGDDWTQAVCDKYIGLDCNGFVGNYVIVVSNVMGPQAHSIRPMDWLSTARAKKGMKVRNSLDDVQALDVLIWPSHIAIIDSVGPVANGRRPFVLTQSSGGGPQYYSTEMVESNKDPQHPKEKFFRITRPAPRGMTLVGGDVKVVSLGLRLVAAPASTTGASTAAAASTP